MEENSDTRSKTSDSNPMDSSKGPPKSRFPVVGIGASAGGLEALRAFLINVPAGGGMAFVIIQHMDPKRKDLLVNILQDSTTMKVVQVTDNLPVKPDHVYVIPPNKKMYIKNRILRLSDYPVSQTLHMTIDFFFQSLAEDQQEKSIGVILSGSGTDGTLGLSAIKERGGLALVQEPASSQFSGMPRSAIEAGLADYVGKAETLPLQIKAYLELDHEVRKEQVKSKTPKVAISTFKKIMLLLRSQTGHDFSCYKRTTLDWRIARRMSVHKIDKINDYFRVLQENPPEVELLFNELLIGVTSFFREPAEWDLLKNKVVPALLSARSDSDTVRVWISGCATGEEAYSAAIVFKEVLQELKIFHGLVIQIFATDLDRDAVNKAREGIFPASIQENITPERLGRYFTRVDRGYQVVKPIRDMIIFAQQNMVKDPPFTRIDLLICRNLLIYLNPEMQKKIIPLFHYSLNPGGYLFLGSAESVGGFTKLFQPLERKSRIYRRLSLSLRDEIVEFPPSFSANFEVLSMKANPANNIQMLTDKIILQRYAPATVLVNNKGDILYITGRTGKYLEPPAGKANWNIFAMAREGFNYALSNAFYQSLRQQQEVTIRNAVVLNEGGSQMVDIIFNPINEPPALKGTVLVVMKDAPPVTIDESAASLESSEAKTKREAELELELVQLRSMWQASSAEMQVSQEELKSSNEELQSTNEELQSTNEELTTTKEEIQSLNEELNMANDELLSKIDELEQTNNDMQNLMDSTDIATLFLNRSLLVNSFTKQMSAVSKLIAKDIGRPVTDIASKLFYPELAQDVAAVLNTVGVVEKRVQSDEGKWYNARILPYRTLKGKTDGVVITFMDITESKALEAELRHAQTLLDQRLADQSRELAQAYKELHQDFQQGRRESAATKDKSGKAGPKNNLE